MRPDVLRQDLQSEARSLLGLAIASFATVAILFLSIVRPGSLELLDLGSTDVLRAVVMIGTAAFSLIAGWLFLRGARAAGAARRSTFGAIDELRRRLRSTEAMLATERQLQLVWRGGDAPWVAASNLPPHVGVPRQVERILEFASWLDADNAVEVEQRLGRLRRDGRAFRLLARSREGADLEIDGRVVTGVISVRVREMTVGSDERRQETAERLRLRGDLDLARALYQVHPSPVWLRDAGGRIVWCNAAYIRTVKAGRLEEVIGKQIELLEARQQNKVAAELAEQREVHQRHAVVVGGERRTYDIAAVADGDGQAFIATDAAVVAHAEAVLKRQSESHAHTLDRVTAGVASFGPDQRLIAVNEGCRRLWQIEPEWLTGSPRHSEILDRLREQSLVPSEADYRGWKSKQLACYGGQRDGEHWWHLPDGRTWHVIAEPRADGGVTLIHEDVSEQLALESRYNALIGVQRETLDHLHEGLAVFGTDGRLRLFNPAFARIWRLNPSDLERQPHIAEVVRRCQVLHDDDQVWRRIKRAVTSMTDQRQRFQGQMTRPDDSVIAYTGLPLPDGAMLLTFIDITSSKRFERLLIERNEALEAGDKLKSQFISHVSYELRTPLTNIIGFSELLARPHTGDLNPKQREYLTDIDASSKTLLAIINDILDLATIDAGAFELKLAPVDVNAVVEAAANGVRERASRAKIALAIELPPDIKTLIADEQRLKQVLFNLLSNAIGFSEPGDSVRLDVSRANGMVSFTVADEGVGIPQEHIDRVFDRFESRAKGSRHRGAGLGLAMVKSLVEQHGGEVSLASVEGKGTTIIARFPENSRRAGTTTAAKAVA